MSVRMTNRSSASVQTIDNCKITETPDTQTDHSSLIQRVNLLRQPILSQLCAVGRFDNTRTNAAQVVMPLFIPQVLAEAQNRQGEKGENRREKWSFQGLCEFFLK
jgi:hypothetical protein